MLSIFEINQLISELKNTLSQAQTTLNTKFSPSIEESNTVIDKYTYKFKYQVISNPEIIEWRDTFIEDQYYYKQTYHDYYKLLLHKTSFDFNILDTDFNRFESALGGQVYLKLSNFPIVIIEPHAYNYTPSLDSDLPYSRKSISFGVLGSILEPTPGDIVNIFGIMYLITNVQTDIFFHTYQCKAVDLWTVNEFYERSRERKEFIVFDNVTEIQQMQIQKVRKIDATFSAMGEKDVQLPKSTVVIKPIEKITKQIHDIPNTEINFLE